MTKMKKRLLRLTLLTTGLAVLVSASALAGKQAICHFPPDNPANFHTIVISDNAVEQHVANHGDTVGSCLANCEAICDDGDFCTQDVVSDPDRCICQSEPRPEVDCDDSNDCTADSCDSGLGACLYNTAILDGDACDDGDPGTSGTVCSGGACIVPQKIVFLTSGAYTGNLVAEANTLTGYAGADGLEAGDAICNYLAAGLGGTYRAWLSTSAATDPESTFAQAAVPYVLTDGTQIASDWAHLITASLENPINVDEAGNAVGYDTVWTATSPDGTSDAEVNGDCGNWQSSAAASRGGRNDLGDSRWTQWISFDCTTTQRLYCFEQ